MSVLLLYVSTKVVLLDDIMITSSWSFWPFFVSARPLAVIEMNTEDVTTKQAIKIAIRAKLRPLLRTILEKPKLAIKKTKLRFLMRMLKLRIRKGKLIILLFFRAYLDFISET